MGRVGNLNFFASQTRTPNICRLGIIARREVSMQTYCNRCNRWGLEDRPKRKGPNLFRRGAVCKFSACAPESACMSLLSFVSVCWPSSATAIACRNMFGAPESCWWPLTADGHGTTRSCARRVCPRPSSGAGSSVSCRLALTGCFAAKPARHAFRRSGRRSGEGTKRWIRSSGDQRQFESRHTPSASSLSRRTLRPGR